MSGDGLPFETVTIGTVLSGGTLFGTIAILLRQIGPWRKQRDEAEQNLREGLTKRVDALEKVLDLTRTKHEAERALDRHKIRNLNQCLDAVLLILETAPEKTVEVVAKVREMRQQQLLAEQQEAAAIHAAEIKARAMMEQATS